MDVTQGFGILTSIIVLAGLSVAIIYGKETAALFTSGANGFATVVRAATLQGGTTAKAQ